jgi:hypothetical protein
VTVGDLVIRKIQKTPVWKFQVSTEQKERLGYGIVLTKQMDGHPEHPCVTVLYPKTGEIYDIAESLVEIISECR